MSELIRCDGCGAEKSRRNAAYLTLDRGGVDVRTMGSWWLRLPMHFCDEKCIAEFVAKAFSATSPEAGS